MMHEVFDDRGRKLMFGRAPQRIVSLVPSDTYSVVALGCLESLVGRTDYCNQPADALQAVPSVGGTKNPNLEAIYALEPDLVLANQEENTRSDLEKIAQAGFKVLVSFPKRVSDGLSHLARLARILRVHDQPKARELIRKGYQAFREAEQVKYEDGELDVFVPIWMDPLMTIHGETYISDMLELCGARNVFRDRERRYPLAADLGKLTPLSAEKVGKRDIRYPRITWEELVQRDPEVVLLPDEPHPFSEQDAEQFRALTIRAAQSKRVVFCEGKDLCWAGAQAVEGLPRLRSLLDSLRKT
jgi:ABC-type Fe3+-hydroxamate transport system substrate-binding protein